MTIKEFLEKGNQIEAEWDFTNFCSHQVDEHFSDNDFKSVDDIVRQACDQDNYSEDQQFNAGSECFNLYDAKGNMLAEGLEKEDADKYIANLK